MVRRLAMAGIVSAAVGGGLLTAPPATAAESGSYSSTVSVTTIRHDAGYRDRRDRRYQRNENINININRNDNRDRRRHRDYHDFWDWD